MYLLNFAEIDSDVQPLKTFFNAGFHVGKINSVQCAKSNTSFVTCGEDGYLRLWNFFESDYEQKQGVLSQYFKEEPIYASMHPYGFFIAIAFTGGYNILLIYTIFKALKYMQY